MEIKEALGLVEEIKNCSLPWDNAHWEALGTVINYVRDKLNEDSKNTWKPSDEQISVLEFVMEDIEKDSIRYAVLNSVLEQLKKLKE